MLQLQGSTRVVVAQDLLVLAKTLAASLALQYITRPAQLIECSPAQYTAYYYVEREPGGGGHQPLQPHCVSAQVGAGEVQSTCQPRIDLGGLDTAFVWLIFANQVRCGILLTHGTGTLSRVFFLLV